jgi:archaeosortase C (PEF-CTERM variant)
MIFQVLAGRIASHRRIATFVALLTTSAGIALLIDRPKGSLLAWIGMPLLVVGGAVFAWGVWPRTVSLPEAPPSLASRILRRITWNRRLIPLFPAFGIAIILADLGYNLILTSSPTLGTEDTLVLLGGITLIVYNLVPRRFAKERDFVLLFFLALNAILVVPLLVARAYYAEVEHSVDVYSWVALAPETSFVLNLLGVSNSVHAVAGSTAPGLTFTPKNLAVQATVVITTACSGIYSFGIFASAFLAFVLTEYERPSARMWMLLGLGLATSYVANVFRMVIIVLVGYYTDTQATDLQNMLIAHSYAGWVIFLMWIALFWGILLKAIPQNRRVRPVILPRLRTPMAATCRACGLLLSPAIPAVRCTCGLFYHRACGDAESACVSCGQLIRKPQIFRPNDA